MRYGITRMVLGFSGFIELSQEEYESIKVARNSLFQALFLEEKFDLVTENYLEYEVELLSSSARQMLSQNLDYYELHSRRGLISRRIVNLLTTCRLYLDQSIHHLGNIYRADHSKINKIREEKSNQYDTYFGYRVMEALRNYVQHRGFPIHSVRYNEQLVEQTSGSKIMVGITPLIKVSAIEEDKEFKKSVLEEMKKRGDELDIKPLMREYIECLGRIQAKARSLLRNDVLRWEEAVFRAMDLYKDTYGSDASLAGLAVAVEADDGTLPESTTIFKEFIERRRELEGKNSLLESLSSCYLTSEVLD
jgi:hypothetical protein